MYKANVNDKHEFELERTKEGLLLDGELTGWDRIEVEPGAFHIIRNNQSYRAEVVDTDFDEKTFVIRVNGRDYTVGVKDRYDLLLQKMGMTNLAGSAVNDIKAPMPGLVLEVKAEEGQQLAKGDPVLILEAMKMENVLKAPGDATVKKVHVSQGDAVEKGQVMVELE